MFANCFSLQGCRLFSLKFGGLLALLAVAGVLMTGSSACAQGGVNLAGKWVSEKDGSVTTFEQKGNELIGSSWGGPNNSTLTGKMRLVLSSNRPLMFKGTYEGTQGKLSGNGVINITVHDNNKIFVRYNGIVTDGKRTDNVNDSGFAVRR